MYSRGKLYGSTPQVKSFLVFQVGLFPTRQTKGDILKISVCLLASNSSKERMHDILSYSG